VVRKHDPPPEPADPAELERRVTRAAGSVGALVDRVEVLQPDLPAVAVTLAVAEPHGFLRHGLEPYLQLAGWQEPGVAGAYLALLDGEPEAVVELTWCGYSGSTRARNDVACCVPFRRGGLFDPGPPPCPAGGRSLDDMLDTFRRHLRESTGKSLEGWQALVRELDSAPARVEWLRREGGLGLADALAISNSLEPGD
jgi:hypothetical protein